MLCPLGMRFPQTKPQTTHCKRVFPLNNSKTPNKTKLSHCWGYHPKGTSWVKWLPSSEVLAARDSLSDSLVSASDL